MARHQGTNNSQTRPAAHQKGALAPRGAQQAGERAAGAAADREDGAERLPFQPKRAKASSALAGIAETDARPSLMTSGLS